MELSVAVRNAKLDAVETAVGTAPTLQIWSGTKPANAAAADAGDGAVLCSITLPSDWMGDADAGAKAKAGTWSGTGAAAAGAGTNATHFRLKQSTTCHIQGTAGNAGDTPEMVLDNKNIAEDQAVTVNSFTLTSGNAGA
jgi:hypothetical protein